VLTVGGGFGFVCGTPVRGPAGAFEGPAGRVVLRDVHEADLTFCSCSARRTALPWRAASC